VASDTVAPEAGAALTDLPGADAPRCHWIDRIAWRKGREVW
jgi:hypothetical protein